MNTDVAYPVLGVYLLLVLGAGIWGAVQNFFGAARSKDTVREHFLAGRGLSTFVWFWTMMATLFSGYSVSGIVNEAYNQGWIATRWIPGGVGLYVAFGIMAPRVHALTKRRGYFTLSQVIFDRFMAPHSRNNYVAHALHLMTFFCLQLPVFTYLITQFQSVGREVRTFTGGEITAITAVLVAAGVLLLCDLLGGMRAVAFTDVIQGIILFAGSIIFLAIQKTELGGLDRAHDFWSNPLLKPMTPRVTLMQRLPTEQNIVAYFDFVAKTTVAATMFPHLTARLFAARDATVIRRGMSVMVFTFFIVQLSSMITGWVAISALNGKIKRGESAFGKLLQVVADTGNGQAVLSALLLASAICAMMSTADSAMLACSSMWVRDIYTKYLRPRASPVEQVVFGKFVGLIALAIGVLLSLLTLETGKPDLSGLFALQTVTPIHVAPAVWLGLHWRRLRGEAVLAGLVSGLGVTLGLVFSKYNIRRAVGSDLLECGLSSAWIGFVVNFGVTVLLGLAMQYFPRLFGMEPTPLWEEEYPVENAPAAAPAKDADAPAPALDGAPAKRLDTASSSDDGHAGEEPPAEFVPRPLDIGPKHDKILNPYLWAFMFLVLLFTTPFYRKPLSWDGYVGAIGAWPFTSLLLSGILAIAGAYMFLFKWENYRPLLEPWNRNPNGQPLELVVDHNTGAHKAQNDPAATPYVMGMPVPPAMASQQVTKA